MEKTKITQPKYTYRYIQMFSKNPHAYRAHAHTIPVKKLLIYLYHLYLYGQWTVMDSSFLKSLTGTARTCGTHDKFHDFTVHYCPLSKTKYMGGGGWRMFPRLFTRTAYAQYA